MPGSQHRNFTWRTHTIDFGTALGYSVTRAVSVRGQCKAPYDRLKAHQARRSLQMEHRYWNEDLETMQPAALHQLENDCLRTQLDYVWAYSAFYQTKFAEAGVKREDIRNVADLPQLPF